MFGMTLLDWAITLSAVLLASGIYVSKVIHRGRYYDDLGFFLTVVGTIGLIFFAGVSPLVLHVEEKQCRDLAHNIERGYDWDSWTGCLLVTDSGDLVPEDRLRFNENGEVTD